MRLLKRNSNGEIELTEFPHGKAPPYAILSHTWGDDEVTLPDMRAGATSKLGYAKIAFCGDQTARDGGQYFWVDTCCIDKTNSQELQESINSMFRWYRDAVVCYVYLADVSVPAPDDGSNPPSGELAFRKSRWFTRGWTLQELIAPQAVEFFSKEGVHLGSRTTLERYICEITGIPAKAFRADDQALSTFTVDERMAWMRGRETTREEDMAYSLLGIFDVHMALIYSEGREKALKRLREEIDKDAKGVRRDDFSIPFGLSTTFGVEEFVAREDELAEIHKQLQSDDSRRVVTLHALGGMGKTQLAIAYAKRHKRDYSAVLWLNASDKASIQQSFAKAATRIQAAHPSTSELDGIDKEKDLGKVVDAVLAWLSLADNTRWLVIYDNYDNPKLQGNDDPAALDVREFLPESDQGSIIITTRVSRVGVGHHIRVQKLGTGDSVAILSTTSRRGGLANDPDAAELANELDGLPLALATAGAYLEQVGTSFKNYLRLYRDSWAKLQRMSPGLNTYDRTLYSTWQLSFEHVQRQNQLSARFLRLWAYFDNQDVWLELLRRGRERGPEWIRQLTEDDLEFDDAVRVLVNYGLIDVHVPLQQNIESRGYSIHACVHAWTVHVLNPEWDYDLARLAIICVAAHVPANSTANWSITQRRLIRHAVRCFSIMPNDATMNDGMEWAFLNLGFLFRAQGRLYEAEKMYIRALQGHEKTLGSDHESTLNTINNLGNLYIDQGKLDEAENMFMRALQGEEKALGPDHTSTFFTVHNLGHLYQVQGRLDEAERMYTRVLQGKERVLGPDHTSTLMTVNNLGILYKAQGRLDEAEQMYARALRGKEKALGTDHTSTLSTVHNLGRLYQDQGKLGEAEQMYVRAIQGKEKAFGPDHKSTLNTVTNLGILYEKQSRLDEAEQAYVRALLGYKRALTPGTASQHRLALNTLWRLGDLFATQGRLSEARTMYSEASAGYTALSGPTSEEVQQLAEAAASLDSMKDDS